jgi:hypothetical protein
MNIDKTILKQQIELCSRLTDESWGEQADLMEGVTRLLEELLWCGREGGEKLQSNIKYKE